MTQYAHIEVTRAPGAFGAEIGGVDLAAPLDPEVVAEIRAAFIEHRVVFFRDQKLTPETQCRFGRYFGELEDYPLVEPLPGHPKVIPVVKEADETVNFGGGWHTDLIYRPVPPMGTMLYAIEVPEHGGDTMFADGIRAFGALSTSMQELLRGLSVEYNVANIGLAMDELGDGGGHGNRSMPLRTDEEVLKATPIHPLVRRHPESGEAGLYFSRDHTRRFAGMTASESRPLLDWIQQHMTQPVFTTRFHWAPGSLVFWDNRCVNHYALNDYPGERRAMHRLTIAGDIPVGA